MAKILVADDNSNIQKMVGIALKDQGIDVVAVGNGEAAVRKISDVKPDLVLADVFMPVRNGYEVCKYVKGDSSLAHIPVILLVGAFDPLDEQEAQRVGADGVLKKPFVPPDPLISMVKSALIRASSGQVASISVEKIAQPAPAETPASAPTAGASPNETAVSHPEPFVDDIPARPAAVKIDSGSQPLAFGSLLETMATPTTETEDDSAFVTPNKELLEREWHSGEEEEEEVEEESDTLSWRRDGGNEAFANEVEASKEKTAEKKKKRETWSPTREKKQELIETEETPEIFTAPVIPPAAKTSPPTIPMTPVAAEPSAKIAAPPVIEKKAPAEPIRPVSVEPSPLAPPTSMPVISAPVTSGTPSGKEGDKPSTGAWFSATSSPWEAEAQKASQLASTWDAAPAAPVAPPASAVPEFAAPEAITPEPDAEAPPEVHATEPELSYDFVSEEPSNEPVFYTPDPALVRNEVVSNERLPDLISDDALSPEAVETIRQETSYALESAAQEAQKRVEESRQKAEQAAAPDMDALVAKVLAKLSPEVLQAVTREILKPVVEAMVREEIKPKK